MSHILTLFHRSDIFELLTTPYEFVHKPRGWFIKIGSKIEDIEDEIKSMIAGQYTLELNCIKYEEMEEAPSRERAALARTAISMMMHGSKK